MHTGHDIRPVTFLKTSAARLLRTLRATRRPVVITQSGEARGVLLDFDTYQELRDATLLLKLVAEGEADLRAGRATDQGRVFAGLRERSSPK